MGPRTVVSGLVNFIPIEQMRDKYLVAVVGLSYHMIDVVDVSLSLVQPQTSEYARHQEFCHGVVCM